MGVTTSRPTPATEETWTTRRLLKWISDALAGTGVESARLCAELLVAHVIGCDRLRLYVEADRPASPIERSQLRELVSRALKHEPVQYLVGEAWFFSLPFHVDERVLIPRPETETIVEAVLQHARATPQLGRGVIADIGTGSGCIIVALLKNLPEAHGIATDQSAEALAVAKENASRHGVADRIDFIQGDLLTALDDHPGGGSLSALVSNPPYIPDAEWAAIPANVRHEPEDALRGGADGLRFVRAIIEGAPSRLAPGGMLAVEFAESTADEALAVAMDQSDLSDQRIERDFQGRPRVVIAHRRA